ncbi:Flagellar hook-associated protein 2 [Marinobacter litoralis]|uniref:Flagellar hook-associated protein 2 n=1 Tax=Marinobacter litoralis TaxID=187981 RepID=A0A3M2RG24_9GAMM|nr:flagellar filament capping protein FliD [Marinobacter litoralis]RMJ03905.1 Flagellar hook-associated protein 2 [Marinobacter litoralis]
MASISSLGVGSGIFSADLVDKLVAAERVPTEERLNSKERSIQAKISAFGALKNALEEMKSPLDGLKSGAAFDAYTSSISNDDVAGVTLDESSVSRGSYTLNVTQLAQRQSLASASQADKDATTFGNGTLTFEVGGVTTEVTIDDSNNTLEGIASAINDAGAGVSAGVVDTGSGYRLVMTSDESGTANAISVTASGDAGLSQFAYDGSGTGMSETVAALDAKLEVNGIAITRSSNTVEGVVEGVTFDLKSTGTSTVVINSDPDAVTERVQEFVDKYNALQDVIKNASGYDAATDRGGALTGDSTIRSLQNELRSLLTSIPGDLQNSPVRMLADLGISTNPDTGKLDFDASEFKTQLADHSEDVKTLFSGDSGIASRALNAVDEYVKFSGRLDNRTEGLNRTLDDIQDQRTKLDDRIESLRARLVKQFSAADALIAQFQSTGNYVAQQLAALAPQNNQNN